MISSIAPAKTTTGQRSKHEGLTKARELHPTAMSGKHKYVLGQIYNHDEFEAMLPFEDHHRYAGEWYLTVPLWGSQDFINYMTSSRELIFGVHYDKKLKIRISPDQPTASADQERKTIWVSPLPFSEDFLRSRGIPQDEWALMSIAASNGTLLHEAAHFARSWSKVTDVFDKIGNPTAEVMKKSGAAYTIANLVEDIYIEHWLADEYPKYLPFLSASHHLYFNDLILVQRIEEAYDNAIVGDELESKNKWQYKVTIGTFLDLAITMKNWRYEREIWGPLMQSYFGLFKEAEGMTSRDARAELVKKIWRIMKKDDRIFWHDPHEDACLGDIPGSEGNKFDGNGASVTVIEMSKEELEKMAAKAKTSKLGNEIGEELEKKTLIILIADGETDIAKIPDIQTQEISPTDSEIKPDKRFRGLGRLLRQTFTHNYTPGEPQKRGQVLVNTRLYRIATDGKIFSYREKRKATGKDYEICILVDCSGSMRGGKIEEAMKVGAAAYGSLRRARIRTYLLGHSSQRRASDESPCLYVIGLPKDPMTKVMRRANRVLSGSGLMHNNYDGLAILEAATYFSKKPTKKWLYVISDGMPSGHNYSGEEANIHTSQSVKQVRQKGIDVVSITIEEGAYRVNDMIYGPKKNVKTNSTKVLKQLIEAMFTSKEGVFDG